MTETIRSELLGTTGLSLAAIVAAFLAIRRRPATPREEWSELVKVFALLVVVQACHFVEEYATGFHDLFPRVLGLAPWPARFFLVFNVVCLAVWSVAVIGLRAGYRAAFFPAWFLALAGMVNGIAHPLLAVIASGYFPGLLTSPLVGVAGLMLWRRLITATD